MKFSDLDQLTEAPDFSSIKGKLQRAGTKLAKHTPFSKKTRTKATAKAGVQKSGLRIKDKFHKWQGDTGQGQTVKSFKEFLTTEYPEYARYVDSIAQQLDLAPKPKPKSAPADDSADQQVEPVSGEKQEDLIPPDAVTGEKSSSGEQSEEEIRAAYKKQGEELEAERIAKGGELTDEDVEEEVDMSASIYESRLNYFLLLERDLKDNQLDTLIVRVLQAAKRKGATSTEQEPEQKAEPDEIEKVAKNVSKAEDEEFSVASPQSSGGSILDEFSDELEDILTTVYKGKEISDNQKRHAKAILDELL